MKWQKIIYGFYRFGKRDNEPAIASDNRVVKASSKRADNYLRFGKKMAPFGQYYGFNAEEDSAEEASPLMYQQRAAEMLAARYGKRSNDFLRFG